MIQSKNSAQFLSFANTRPYLLLLSGKYDFSHLLTFYKQLNDEFGPIVKFNGLEPNADLIFLFDPKDVETVFRNDGLAPIRPPLKSLDYYRKHTRKAFFKGTGGILVE